MSAIDVDPKTLEIGAAASAHAYEQAIVHIGEEITARDPQNLDALIGSLAAEGPYAYTILPEVGADGSVKLPVLTTREEIDGAYGFIRGLSDLHEVIGLTEIRGAWYLFQDAISRGGPKGSRPAQQPAHARRCSRRVRTRASPASSSGCGCRANGSARPTRST